jgi:hypothetical protein
LAGFERYLPELEGYRQVETPFKLERSAVEMEITRIKRMVKWCQDRLGELAFGMRPFQISYGSLRVLKAGILFEIAAIEAERDKVFSTHRRLPKSVMQAINDKVASLRNLAESGILNGMIPASIVVETAPIVPEAVEVVAPAVEQARSSRVVAALRIELVDPEIRRRCGDLFEQFTLNLDDQDRFDTVLREASAVLEERIRTLSGLPANQYGLDLVSRALAVDTGELILSGDRNEQEAGHLLFRGFFGFVRNTVGHHLVPAYTKERAGQVLAYVDYLLFLLSQARRRNPPILASAP